MKQNWLDNNLSALGDAMDPDQLLKRYETGASAAVWPDLIGLGACVFEEPLRSVALDICREIVGRARINLEKIHGRLVELGYEFAEPDSVIVAATAEESSAIDSFEAEFGTMPLIARVWYQTFASINFSQADHQCRSKEFTAPAAPEIFGLGSHPVLVMQGLERARAEAHRMNARRAELLPLYKKDYPDFSWDEQSQFLALGTPASNCEPKGFTLPCVAIDGVIYNDGGGDIYFVGDSSWGFSVWAHNTYETLASARAALGKGPESSAVNFSNAIRSGVTRTPQHHIFPQQFRQWFLDRGIHIDRFTIAIGQGEHAAIHRWVGGAGWNQTLMNRLLTAESQMTGQLSARQIWTEGYRLLREVGIRKPTFLPY